MMAGDDYLSKLDKATASNRAIQPGRSVDYPNYPSQGKEIDNDYHPVDKGMGATEDHWGTVRSEGINRLRTQFQQSDSGAWKDAAGKDSKIIESLVRGRE